MKTEIYNESQDKIREARKNFIEGNSIASPYMRPEVLRAWERCRQKDVSPLTKSAPAEDAVSFQRRLKKNAAFIQVVQPAIEKLYHFIKNSSFTIAISDAQGYLLTVQGDSDMVDSAMKGNGIPGADWSESGIGNNPIGTAIAEDRPLQVFGYEHYCLCAKNWAGSGAPIHDPDGSILGAISICGKKENVNYHTLGMAFITAYSIEKQLTILQALEKVDLAYKHNNIIIDAIDEGVITFDRDKKILSQNKMVTSSLGGSFVGRNLADLFLNKSFLNSIDNKVEVTDYMTNIIANGKSVPFTITYRIIKTAATQRGILLMTKVSRVKKLAQKIVQNEASFSFETIIGQDKNFIDCLDLAKTAANTDAHILLTGESGTGKDVIAQSIYNSSSYRSGNFIAVNCGAIPKELIASELFGYEEGAFTGAKKGGQTGKFLLANGGTIFLDEIGEMPLQLQSYLLRVIEQKVINPVGSQTYLPIDVRIISATNKDLMKEVAQGNFRQDLYYRLNVFSINIPPLRERKDDIPLLTRAFIEKFNHKYTKSVRTISEEVRAIFMNYDWPGNIRELQNIVERTVILAKGPLITSELLPYYLQKTSFLPAAKLLDIQDEKPEDEKECIKRLLEKNYWNISRAAKEMGVARSTLYSKIKLYNLRESKS